MWLLNFFACLHCVSTRFQSAQFCAIVLKFGPLDFDVLRNSISYFYLISAKSDLRDLLLRNVYKTVPGT